MPGPATALQAYALSFPGAWEDHPWGETVVKVGKKVFVFLGRPESGFSVTAKLPITYPTALAQPFAARTGYGLGDSGWVTATFPRGAKAPVELLKAWIDESYRAVAPKKLVEQLEGGGPAGIDAGGRARRGKGSGAAAGAARSRATGGRVRPSRGTSPTRRTVRGRRRRPSTA